MIFHECNERCWAFNEFPEAHVNGVLWKQTRCNGKQVDGSRYCLFHQDKQWRSTIPTNLLPKRLSWQEYALDLAFTASRRSEDPHLKAGACALRHDHSVAALAYNGAPPGIEIDWLNRDERRKRVIHAESNLLRYIKPYECYLVALTISPCSDCVKQLAAYGIKEIYFKDVYDKDKFGITLAQEFNINIYQKTDNGFIKLEKQKVNQQT